MSMACQLPKHKQTLQLRRQQQRRRCWLIRKSRALARMPAAAFNMSHVIRYEPWQTNILELD
jgi:hypothetical protein